MSKRYCTQLFATALTLLLPAQLLGQQQPGSGERVLPNFDSRLTIPRQAAARPDIAELPSSNCAAKAARTLRPASAPMGR